ncbi:MAG TPA: FCD domain-containing protein [Acidimicrobiales bacterium]|nr:FCD domain-containing protein [Acidimicrobiales bacterium]
MAKRSKTSEAGRATRFDGPSITRATGNGLSQRSDGTKLASVVADRIIDDIAAAGWPVGIVVGSEPELLERHGVSRAVFREAVRLLEHLQVARMRRGPGGGLVVMPATADSVIDAVSVYLFYVGATIEEVAFARRAVEETAVELAAARIDESGIEALRALVAAEGEGAERDHRALHNLVAQLSGNPALAFFVDLLNRVMLLYYPATRGGVGKDTLTASAHAHARIAEAVLSGDPGLARARMRRHLEAEAEYMRAKRASLRRLADLPAATNRSEKRAEQVATQIFGEVARDGWRVGSLLGSEAELMERYDVSRAVLREAVRVLEHHQVARMRRGPGGGLFVTEPGVQAVTEALALQIDRLGIERSHLFEVRTALENVVLDLVLDHLDDDGIATLQAALEAERAATTEEFVYLGHDLHGVLATVAGNRVLELLTLVLVRLSRLRSAAPPGAPPTLPTDEVMHVHRRIVEAIIAGDRDLARHRMRRHLDALVTWTR